MKLLLDEMYPPLVAARLRGAGHDVQAIADLGLMGVSDSAVAEAAFALGRALVTENVGDFAPLYGRLGLTGADHPGLILTSARRFPRTADALTKLVDAIAAQLETHPSEHALAGHVVWLQEPAGP